MANTPYFLAEGYQGYISSLDKFVEECLQSGRSQDLVRLSTYLRRYISPAIAQRLFRQSQLDLLLQQGTVEIVAALVLDMRGFVRTTRSGESMDSGLHMVACLLQALFARIIRAAFENRGLVGELAGDRVLVIFGFPRPSDIGHADIERKDDLAISVQNAVRTALAIQDISRELQQDTNFPQSIRNFEVGIGICAGGPAWIGDIGYNQALASQVSWRQELTVISTVVNKAARAEELTKEPPNHKIIVGQTVINQLEQLIGQDGVSYEALGERNVRGLDERVEMFALKAAKLPGTESVREADILLADWICEHIDGAVERDTFSRIRRALSDVGQVIIAHESLDESTVFQQMMDQIIESFNARKVTLYQIDPILPELIAVMARGSEPLFEPGTRLPRGKGIANWVAETGKSFLSPDVHTDPQWGGGRVPSMTMISTR